MRRGKEIIYISHCILNQNSVIREWERARGAFNEVAKEILDKNISIIQLPCPEFTFLGEARPPMTKAEYSTKEYRGICRELAEKVVTQMKEYVTNNYTIVGMVGISNSPSCDILGEQGVFMEELQKLMKKQSIELKIFDIPSNYIEGESMNVINEFRNFIYTRGE